MTDDDKFFERLRGDAAPLRYRADDAALARIHARIHERIAVRPTVAQLLAAWFRPLAATLAAVAVAAGIGLASMNGTTDEALSVETVEVTLAGDTYLVGD